MIAILRMQKTSLAVCAFELRTPSVMIARGSLTQHKEGALPVWQCAFLSQFNTLPCAAK